MSWKRRIVIGIISFVIVFSIFSVIFHSFWGEKWSNFIDKREIINLKRENGKEPSDWLDIEHEYEFLKPITQDIEINIVCDPVQYVSNGLNFSFSVKDRGLYSLSREEIEFLRAYIYIIDNENKIVSEFPHVITWGIEISYQDEKTKKWHYINIKEYLEGKKYKYHLDLKRKDTGEWRLIVLCVDMNRDSYYLDQAKDPKKYISNQGGKIEWEEKSFKVYTSKEPIEKWDLIGIFLIFVTSLSFIYSIFSHYYNRIVYFLNVHKIGILVTLILYSSVILFLYFSLVYF